MRWRMYKSVKQYAQNAAQNSTAQHGEVTLNKIKPKTRKTKAHPSPTGRLIIGAYFLHSELAIWGQITEEISDGVFHAALSNPDGKPDGCSRLFTTKDVTSLLFMRDREMWLASVQASMADCEEQTECDCPTGVGCECNDLDCDECSFRKRVEDRIVKREQGVQAEVLENLVQKTIADSAPSAETIAACRAELEAAKRRGYPC